MKGLSKGRYDKTFAGEDANVQLFHFLFLPRVGMGYVR